MGELEELEEVVRTCPWAGEGLDPTRLVVAFGRVPPPADAVERLRGLAVEGEQVTAIGRDLHLRLPHGQGRSKLAAAVGRADLGGPVTARNWRTVTKLLELLSTR